jgi:hypothetical protein
MIIPLLMALLLLVLVGQNLSKEHYGWDFDDFPDMCKKKLKKTEEELAFANTPHFGGTPNNSQVWM